MIGCYELLLSGAIRRPRNLSLVCRRPRATRPLLADRQRRIPGNRPLVLVLLCLLDGIFSSAVALFVVSRREMGPISLLAGSIFPGAGFAILHYTGMAAM